MNIDKLKTILETYTKDFSEWLDQPEAKETILEFIDKWAKKKINTIDF